MLEIIPGDYMPRSLGRITIICYLLLGSISLAANDDLSYRSPGDFIQYPNPNATNFYEPVFDSSFFPVLTDWGQEVYVSDTTWWFYNPRIVVGDTVLHIFGEGNLQPIHYRSHDNGATWQFWANYHDTSFNVPSGIMNAFCERNGLYTVWRGRRGNNWAFTYFKSSTNSGQTWPISAEIGVDPDWWDTRYGNVAGHKDTAFVSFTQYAPGVDSLACWRTTNRGSAWTNRRFIADSWGVSYPPSICYAAGVVHIVFNKDWDHQTDVFYMRSTDYGQTWSEPVLLGFDDQNHGQWPELWADSLGNVGVCWMDYHGSPYGWTGGIWCRVSHDYGESWPGFYRLDDDYLGYPGTTVVVAGDYLAVGWVSSNSPPIVHVRESTDGGENWGDDQAVAQGDCHVPRLAKKGTDLYLIWWETEYLRPDFYVDFIKFMRNDLRVGIGSPEARTEDKDGLRFSVYPNPFNSTATITLNSVEGGDREIRIYDIRGALVRSLCLGKEDTKATWDATDNSGQKVSSGLYFAKAIANTRVAHAKLLYLK